MEDLRRHGFVPFAGGTGAATPGCAGRAAVPGGPAFMSIFFPAHPLGVPAESSVDGALSPQEHRAKGDIASNEIAASIAALEFIGIDFLKSQCSLSFG